jgi:hypothetical protein
MTPIPSSFLPYFKIQKKIRFKLSIFQSEY